MTAANPTLQHSKTPPPHSAVVVIPARYGSTRLPGKALIRLCGKPLVQWVYERARQARAIDRVLVATDDERIAEAVRGFGGEAVMTGGDHPSGTDRVAEAIKDHPADIVVNVQGDEPLMDPALIDNIACTLRDDPQWDMATAATPIVDRDDLANPAVVKVIWGADHRALYFSRSLVPCVRDAKPETDVLGLRLHWRHIGIYGYRRAFLQALVASPPCALEDAEKLEQLRALHLGARMKVLETEHVGLGVDTLDDVPKAEAALHAAGLA